jgi:cation transport regulator ChaB
MPRISVPNVQTNTLVSSGGSPTAANAIANTPSLGTALASGASEVNKALIERRMKKDRTEMMANLAEFETQQMQRLSDLENEDLGDSDVSEAFSQEYDDAYNDLLNSAPSYMRDEFKQRATAINQGIANNVYSAQARQDAARIKQNTQRFTENAVKRVITNPNSIGEVERLINEYTANIPANAEAKQAYREAAIDSAYLNHANALAEQDPVAVMGLIENGFYTNKVSPKSLLEIQKVKGDVIEGKQTEISLLLATSDSLDDLTVAESEINGFKYFSRAQKNRLKIALVNRRNQVLAASEKAVEEAELAEDLVNNRLPYDSGQKSHVSAINTHYSNYQRLAERDLLRSKQQFAEQNPDAEVSLEITDSDRVRINKGYVQRYGMLPQRLISEIGTKAANMDNLNDLANAMTEIRVYSSENAGVLADLPKPVRDKYEMFETLSDGTGSDTESVVRQMRAYHLKSSELSREQFDTLNEDGLRQSVREFENMADISLSNAVPEPLKAATFSFFEETFGVGRKLDRIGGFVQEQLFNSIGAGANRILDIKQFGVLYNRDLVSIAGNSDESVLMLEAFWKESYRNGYRQSNGDEYYARRYANRKAQDSFSISRVGRVPQLMYMAPEKWLRDNGYNFKARGFLGKETKDNEMFDNWLVSELQNVQTTSGEIVNYLEKNPDIDISKFDYRLLPDAYSVKRGSMQADPAYNIEILGPNNNRVLLQFEGEPISVRLRDFANVFAQEKAK